MNQKKQHGFTLIEMIIGINIMVLVGFAIYNLERNIFMLTFAAEDNLVVQQQLRQVFLSIGNEMRTINSSNTGTYPIYLASSTAITFYSDINQDGLQEQVRYYLSGKNLKKGVIIPTGAPLAYATSSEKISDAVNNLNNVNKPIFEYYSDLYNGSSSPLTYPMNLSAIRLIKTTIIVDRYVNRSPSQIEMSTQVSLRNLKDNQ
jgi:prepilin-type N-terminal cleavage/methylation domain-containing protein